MGWGTVSESILYFLLISLSDIFYLSQEIASNVLIVLNKIHYRAIVYVVSATVNVILSSFWQPKVAQWELQLEYPFVYGVSIL